MNGHFSTLDSIIIDISKKNECQKHTFLVYENGLCLTQQ